MSDREAEFLELLRTTFQAEAQEHLHAMSTGLLDLEKLPPGDGGAAPLVETVFREAHSLKGAARAAGFAEIEALCQRMESVFAAWKKGDWQPSPEKFDVLHRSADRLGELAGGKTVVTSEIIAAISSELDALLHSRPTAQTAPPEPQAVLQPQPGPGTRPIGSESIRISTDKLDRMVLQAEEMLTARQTAGQRVADLRGARQFFEQWKKEWLRFQQNLRAAQQSKTQSAERDTAAWDSFFDFSHNAIHTLEQKLSTLLKAAEQDDHALGKMVGELLDGSKKLLMVPLNSLFATIPIAVRELARDQGKTVELVVRGGEIELDRRIIEEMKDPMLHLVRNAVDHGVERPEVRTHSGKPAGATITITVAQADGNSVAITVADDGAGIDLKRVRDAAVKARVVTRAAADALGDAEALQLIFASDVSTAKIITEISGRGLGLAIVREKAEKLGGYVSVRSQPGLGTTFSIVLPLTLATFRGVLVRSGGQTFVLPTAAIAQVARVSTSDIRTVENRETILHNGVTTPCVRLAAILGQPQAASAHPRTWSPVVVLGHGDDRIAFIVDDVLSEEEVLVKRLSRPLVRLRHIAGATVLGSGRAVPILNVGDLLKSATRAHAPAPAVPAQSAKGPQAKKRILIVEDSITSRMLLKNIVESAGYEVRTAVDGVDAFGILRTGEFDLVMSDVDMPRMNGFSLTGKIRGDRRLGELPVVLITALGSSEDRERGIDAGASAYIIKSSFDQSNLLDTLRRLLGT